ncbi:MAG: hypothetical protein OYG32_03510, partial [Rhodospirillaceae bacterium]|nr:hypothetical protein [Rhodospirillaceae bacterium]
LLRPRGISRVLMSRYPKIAVNLSAADVDADLVCHAPAGSTLVFRLVIGMLAPVYCAYAEI